MGRPNDMPISAPSLPLRSCTLREIDADICRFVAMQVVGVKASMGDIAMDMSHALVYLDGTLHLLSRHLSFT